MGKNIVLVVDDEPDVVESITFSLNAENIDTIEAYNGEDALDMAKKTVPKLIILDVMLPKINGYKVARLLKFDELYKSIPIIMLTARVQKDDVKLGKTTGADEYMTKPFDMPDLISKVKKYLAA